MGPIDFIKAEKDGAVGRFTINRADKRNAMSLAMWERMGEVFTEWADDPDLRVVIVRGAGDVCFCAGNDIKEFDTVRADATGAANYEKTTSRAYKALRQFPKPTIARVAGLCIGGGLELAQLCDLQIVSTDARFGVTPAKLGLGYKLADVSLLTAHVPAKFAKEMLFTGALFDAKEALRWGLINRVVDLADLDGVVDELATTIAANAPLSVSAAKVIVEQSVLPAGSQDIALCQQLVDRCHDSDDYAEGRRAFAEKRNPVFTGK